MDKKVLTGALIVMLAAGCMNDMPYRQADGEPQLVMNSLMTASEEEHRVYLSVSRTDRVDSLTGPAELRVFVNGKAAGTASEKASGLPHQRMFVFRTPFAEGDQVRLEASAGDFHASAEVSVYGQPVLGSIDTLSAGDSLSQQLCFEIGLEDKWKGADYYSLGIYCCTETEFFLDKTSLGVFSSRKRCALDCSEDLILSEENIAANNMGVEFGTPNRYGAFFDSQFDCGSVVLRPRVDKSEFMAIPDGTPVIADSISVRRSLEIQVSHIDVRHYYYLKAVNGIGGSSADLALEDVSVPDNVDGGIGFVGIGNAAAKTITLPE